MMDTLSKYMADAKARALPAEAELHAKHHLLDTLAAMISGSDLHPGWQPSAISVDMVQRVPQRSRALRSRPPPVTRRLPTVLWLTRTRPMTRTTHRDRIPVALSYRRHLQSGKN